MSSSFVFVWQDILYHRIPFMSVYNQSTLSLHIVSNSLQVVYR